MKGGAGNLSRCSTLARPLGLFSRTQMAKIVMGRLEHERICDAGRSTSENDRGSSDKERGSSSSARVRHGGSFPTSYWPDSGRSLDATGSRAGDLSVQDGSVQG